MENKKDGYRIDEALAAVDEAAPGAAVMSRRSFAKFGAAVAAAAAMGTLGTYAYFTGTDRKENQVSVADNLNVKVVEPAWDPESAKNVVPGQHIPKDPRIRNLHDAIDGYLFVEIRVPTAVVEVFDEATMTVLPAARTPLFTFDASEEWVVLQQFDDGDDVVWRFGWPNPIGPKSDTPPIFEEVVFANLVQAQGQAGEHVVGVTGYGIQATGFSDCRGAWDAYKKQNGLGDGAPPAGVSAVTAGGLLKFAADTPPEVGDTLEGAEVTCVVTDVEKGSAGCLSDTPEVIERVECLVPTAPEDTSGWFSDMSACETMDLSGLDTGSIKASEGMFDNTVKLVEVTMSPAANPSILPEGFEATDNNVVYRKAGKAYALALMKKTDGSEYEIVFVKTDEDPNSWNQYNGMRITNVYSGIENLDASLETKVPWHKYRNLIVSVACIDKISPISTASWFSNCLHLANANLALLDMSKATKMTSMFAGCTSLTAITGQESWNVSSCTDMKFAFYNCKLLASLSGIPSWDVSKVSDMSWMLYNCNSLAPLDLSAWAVDNVTKHGSFSDKAPNVIPPAWAA